MMNNINFNIKNKRQIESFLNTNNLISLYKDYKWRNDFWDVNNGFVDIEHLESEFNNGKKSNEYIISKNNISLLNEWGNSRYKNRINFPEEITLSIKKDNDIKTIAETTFYELDQKLRTFKVRGLGPTYISKILRFLLPEFFGAIDTNIVIVFGSNCYNWLNLKVSNSGYGNYINRNQSGWPREYIQWVLNLKYITYFLNKSGIKCPHPGNFIKKSLRKENIWLCADVEMALFTLSYKKVKELKN